MARKALILAGILWLIGAAQALGQDTASCTTLYDHGQHDVILCHAGDTFTKTETSGSSISETVITPDLYRQLMEQDTADLKAQAERMAAAQAEFERQMTALNTRRESENNALQFTHKKACIAAGYAWTHGFCSPKGEK